MIQRIQSIFLLLSGCSLGGSFALPFADSAKPIPGTLFADSLFTAMDSPGIAILLGLAGAAAIAAIFLFNNRQLQRNVCWAAIICSIGAIAFGVFYFMQEGAAMGEVAVSEEPGAILPPLAIAFAALAIFYIGKDEKLVRSADRLR